MKLRPALGVLVIAATLGASAWVFAQRDVRRVRELLDQVENDLARECAREPGARPPLRSPAAVDSREPEACGSTDAWIVLDP